MAERQSIADRFWSKVEIREPKECWPWKASVTTAGYGQFFVSKDHRPRVVMAHRVAWELTYGSITGGLWVLHRCDNPPCCNPMDLFLGTNTDNLNDAVAKRIIGSGVNAWPHLHKDRISHGESHYRSKLTNEHVIRIRGDSRRLREIAVEFGISEALVSMVRNRKRWRHIS